MIGIEQRNRKPEKKSNIFQGNQLLNTKSLRMISESKAIICKHKIIFKTPPGCTPADHSVDGPLLGNGDMGVAIGGEPNALRFYLHKNDMWRLQHGYHNSGPVGFGNLLLNIPGLKGASYHVTQDIYTATTEGLFKLNESAVNIRSYVAAGENLFIIEMTAEGKPFNVNIILEVADGRDSDSITKIEGSLLFGKRAFIKKIAIPTGVAVACKVFNDNAVAKEISKNSVGTVFVLQPGETTTMVMAMDSIFKDRDYESKVINVIESINQDRVEEVEKAHFAWWAAYWAKSYVSINDPIIEQQYYRSLYGMGSCSRNINFPPAIFGWVTTDRPGWDGDYHLNYNHMAPFYGLARANRLEQADPHDTPILDFLERAMWHCKEIFGYAGVIYPVGIGPMGIETTYGYQMYIDKGSEFAENKGLFYGQRTNGAYALVNMAPRWYTTYDYEYGRKIYPLVSKIATFWENYVTWDVENRRFIIDNDSVHEGSGRDLNSCLSIGLVRNALLLALDMSEELGVDENRREKWNHILKHLSGYAYQQNNGRKVFRYTEKGTPWRGDNTVGIQQIYPAGQIHLDSHPELLEVSHNTIDVMQRWLDINGSNSFFPAAVRINYDPGKILRELRKYSKHTYPNGFQSGNPHGIENFSTVPNTINEMLCMGHKGVIRLFRVWPKTKDASFVNIRCWGAFLVSAEFKNGRIKSVVIISEKGRQCTVVNPWPGRRVQLIRNGKKAEVFREDRLTFPSETNEKIELYRSRHIV